MTRALLVDDEALVRTGLRMILETTDDELTDREKDVLAEVGRGRTNAEIGRTLHMSEATVKTHVSHLFDKLGATNRVQVAIFAQDARLAD